MLRQMVNWEYQWGQIVGRAWADDTFKHRLLADPARVLTEYELAPTAGLRIEVLDNPGWEPESTAEILYLVLPAKPSAEELCEDELCSASNVEAVARCGCEWCNRCQRCHCEWCGGCHHPPRPDQA